MAYGRAVNSQHALVLIVIPVRIISAENIRWPVRGSFKIVIPIIAAKIVTLIWLIEASETLKRDETMYHNE